MERAKSLLPLTAFCLYFLKIGILGASLQDAFVLLVLASFAAFMEYKISDKKIAELNNKVDTRQKELEAYVKDIDTLKSSVAGMKMSTAMRPLGNVNR
jgi:hypothetical protein